MDQQLNQASISLLDVLRGMGRRKLLICAITLLSLAGGVGFIMKTAPVYTTESQLIIENLSSPYDRTQLPDEQRGEAIGDRDIQSQISVLKSRDLALQVVKALKLEERDEFDPLRARPPGMVQTLLLSLGFGEDPRSMTPEQRALKRYASQLVVYQTPESNVVSVRYSANDAKTAAEVANALARSFVSTTAETKLKPTARAREWLAGQIDDLRKKLSTSEAAIESFRAQAGLLKGERSTLGTQELSELNSQITLAQTARTEAEERAKSISQLLATKGTVDASNDVLNSPNVQQLREQQVTAAKLVAELRATYLPNHPKMIAAQNQLNSVDRQIRAEALKVVQGLGEQAKIAQAREESLRARLEEMKGSETTANQDDVKLQAMEREAAADKVLLESLLLRYADANTRQNTSTQPGIARIIQEAAAPTSPSFPKPGPTVLLATLAGLALSLGLSFLLEVMSASNRLAQAFPLPQIPEAIAPEPTFQQAPVTQPVASPPAKSSAMIPLASFPVSASPESNVQLLSHKNSTHVASAGPVAEWALDLHASSSVRQLAVFSVGDRYNGSSLGAVLIARAIAARNARVIVVDLKPSGSIVDMLFGLPPGPGFADLLSGSVDFTKVISRDAASSAHLLRFGKAKDSTAASLLNQRVDTVLDALATIYDIVIVHAGEATSSTPSLISNCQAALILAPANQILEAAKAAQMLSAARPLSVQIIKLEPVGADASRAAAVA
jgi:polysaccharide biosynthesis transport protein